MTIIGIDPGKSGGIAWSNEHGVCVEKMPETLADLWDLIFRTIACRESRYCIDPAKECIKAYLEDVQPGGLCAAKSGGGARMGSKSSFTFGRGLGNLEMALAAASIPFERVRPQLWQKAMGCMTKGDKNVSKRKAQELFPSLKVTHATADALLIAEYGKRLNFKP